MLMDKSNLSSPADINQHVNNNLRAGAGMKNTTGCASMHENHPRAIVRGDLRTIQLSRRRFYTSRGPLPPDTKSRFVA